MSTQNNEQILNPNDLPEDLVESTLRPLKINEFIGQNHLKNNLEVFINSAKNRQDVLDHVLLYGPPGLGKTTIAQIIAHEMGVNFRTTSGPMITKTGDLAAIVTNLEHGDVLFIDEIHRLNPAVEEVLYPAMEDYTLDLIIGEGPAARTIKIDIPKFTLIGATTKLGMLTNPLRDRFGIPLRLNFYEPQDLALIIKRGAGILNIAIDPKAGEELASRSRGTPRIALRLLRRIRDFATVGGHNAVTHEMVTLALKNLEVDSLGLDSNDLRYLNFVARNYNGGPVGIDTIAAGLSEARDSLEETIEPYLLQKGLIQRTPRGRMLTKHSFDHLGLLVPNNLDF